MQQTKYKVYVVDSFAEQVFGGNQAGVVLLNQEQEFPAERAMLSIAAELKHSETAFLKKISQDIFKIRYFTPLEEVDLCGHATIAAAQVLFEEKEIGNGCFHLQTKVHELAVNYHQGDIWMEMAPPEDIRVFTENEAEEIYQAYGLTLRDMPEMMLPEIISTGLNDILLAVKTEASLSQASQDVQAVTQLSKKYNVVGVHMYFLDAEPVYRAKCRNFAPLCGILEEAATGTSNGALTYYLYKKGHIQPGEINLFRQGEVMRKPSVIKSRLILGADAKPKIEIGGSAVISLKGEVKSGE